MISYLKGQINYKAAVPKKDNYVVLLVGGVGYKVFVSDKLINEFHVGQEVELFIFTQVAETVLDFYGFQTKEELDFFELLISISGIGPRSAFNIIQKAKVDDLRSAVSAGSADTLNKVAGVGPKTAQKIVDGLKDKLGSLESNSSSWSQGFGDALDALIGLGYSASQAQEALRQCQSQETGDKVKEALKYLSGAK